MSEPCRCRSRRPADRTDILTDRLTDRPNPPTPLPSLIALSPDADWQPRREAQKWKNAAVWVFVFVFSSENRPVGGESEAGLLSTAELVFFSKVSFVTFFFFLHVLPHRETEKLPL